MKKERTPHDAAQDLQYALTLIRIRWDAYKAIRVGQVYEVSDPEMYKTVRQRLKRMFMGNEEKLSRFKLISDDEHEGTAHKLTEFLYLLGEKLRK